MNPYLALLRLDKPIGIWLLFFPAAWGVALAGGDGALILLMLIGAIITRAAGCILNDLTDRTLDAKVARTKHRPLASGAVPVSHAIIILTLLLAAALAIALSLPITVFYIALIALPMIAVYPWMKRLTWWPQAFLGLTFNLGSLMGWAATGTPLSPASFTLYFACVFWTLGYDTIYAVQDMADDEIVGIRSSARALGPSRIRHFAMVCYGLMIALLALTGLLQHISMMYYVGLILMGAQLRWQVRALPCTPERAGVLFNSNQWAGLFLLLGLLIARIVAF